MNTSDLMFEIVKLTIPGAMTLLAAYFVLHKLLQREERQAIVKVKKERSQVTLPMRLQAYERLVLFLERISPENLLMRVQKPGMSAAQLQQELLAAIRGEYEHNIAQQIYVSSHAWNMVKSAKEEVVRVIHLSATELSEKATSIELSKKIFERITAQNQTPVQKANDFLKAELRKLF